MRIIVAVLLLAMNLGAQEFRATVTGRVTDPSGAPAPGVHVRAIGVATNNKNETTSATTGDYLPPFLPPGPYRIEAAGPGFKQFVRFGIELRVDDRVEIPIALEIGTVSESVTVVANTPVVETSTGSVGEVISAEMLVDMPLNGRNAYMLAGLVPGSLPTGRGTPAFFLRTTSNNSTTDLSIGGGAVGFNEVSLDGVPMTGGSNTVTHIPSIGAASEFKVQTNAFDAGIGCATYSQRNPRSLRIGGWSLHCD